MLLIHHVYLQAMLGTLHNPFAAEADAILERSLAQFDGVWL